MVSFFRTLTVFALSLAMSVCGPTPPAPGAAGADASHAATGSGREAASQITVFLEGEKETVPATLYETVMPLHDSVRENANSSFSLYIPNEGWQKEPDSNRWVSTVNPKVFFEVWIAEGGTPMIFQEFFLVKNPGFSSPGLEERDWSYFTDKATGTEALARMLYDGECGCAIWGQYPAEAVEGFGALVKAIAETLETGTLPALPEQGTIALSGGELPGRLYTGNGYTLYIPSEGWSETVRPENNEVIWTMEEQKLATLSVRVWPGLGRVSEDALFAAVQAAEPDAALERTDHPVFRQVNDSRCLTIYYYQYGDTAYTVRQDYPNEAEIGYGSVVWGVAQTFRMSAKP
ncbi:hypothetical protein [Oscillibacter sp.]|uniref:hypothetical protein n=1 Tax=Oscillibacter sp. TaxID=1945593 RepID=UPI00262206B2|nr:hypothetical protein [Oscillibacter sp.]MDD3347254.1 hypothetical protein [Oscillibacter sp.]